MAEDTLDGSNLETQAEPVQEQGTTPPVQPEQQTQPPQTNIPEQYRDKSPEELYQEIHKLSSANGRLKAELQRQPQQIPQYQPQVPQLPQSTLPGHEAFGQRQPQKSLDEVFWDNPSKVLAEVVGQEVNKGIQNYRYQEAMQHQQIQQQRLNQILAWDDMAIDELRRESVLEETINFSDEHETLMEALAKKDGEVKALMENPRATQDDVRRVIRNLHAKADKILNGDPERLKAVMSASKQAAINGAPQTRAASTTGQPAATIEDRANQHLKDRGWGFLG